MASTSFHLKEPNGDKATAIFIWFNPQNGGGRVRLYTGDKILPSQWEAGDVQQARTPKRSSETERNKAINANNERMSKRLLAYWDECRAQGTLPSPEELRAVIEPALPAAIAPDRPQPLADYSAFLARKAGQYAENTIKSHTTTFNHFTRYVSLTRRPFEYKDFTRDWVEKFGAWLAAGYGVREFMADGSVNKQLKNLKEFLKDAANRGRTPRIDVTGWGWKFVEPEAMALTAAELARIEALEELPSYLENARCLWLLMAYTGLRYSDAMKLKPEHDKGDVLRLVPQKTTEISATVYIRKATRALLGKCWTGEVHGISNTKLNEYIKHICQRASIDELTEKIRYYGQTSRPKKEVFQKWELVSCHTARRTFITLSFAKEIPLELIMMAAGHTNAKTTLRYNQNTEARQIEVSRRVWEE